MLNHPTPARLEAFSDGVLAVIITIMVLEFKVPREDGLAGFLRVLPIFAVYLMSFIFVGIYWINHHHLIDRLKRVDALILWANLSFLFTLSLLPFFTSYLVEKGVRSFPVALYAGSLLLDGFTFTLLTWSILRHFRHSGGIYEDAETVEQLAENRKGTLSLAMYLIAIPSAFWHPVFALTIVCAVTLIWIVPTFGVKPPPHDGRQRPVR